MKYRQQVSRNAYGGVRVIGRKEVEGASVPFDVTITDPEVVAAADLLDSAVDEAMELDGSDPNYAPAPAEPEPEPETETPEPVTTEEV